MRRMNASEPRRGFEPLTCRLQGGCSAGLSYLGVVRKRNRDGGFDRFRRLGRGRTSTTGRLVTFA